ncbi:MAG: DUF4124 domain-containing protein [Betaproteobacteria bacterium]
MTHARTAGWHSRVAMTALVRGAVVTLLIGIALPVTAQVFKCVDKAGRTTYQQQPCPDANKSSRMDLPINNGSGMNDAADNDWSAMAKRKEVAIGMPRAFVVQAHGTPQEMRPGRADENAIEVWRYRRPDLDLALGFNKGLVAWTNNNFSDAPAVALEPEPSVRKNFYVARKCADLVAEAGAPTAINEELDEAMARKVMRHVWESAPGDRERTMVTCVDGVVMRVERIPAQQ